jgi:hypothetical protein
MGTRMSDEEYEDLGPSEDEDVEGFFGSESAMSTRWHLQGANCTFAALQSSFNCVVFVNC